MLDLGESCNYGLITRCALPNFTKNFCSEWQIYVYTRTELDEAQVFVDNAIFTFFSIGHNATCHSTSNLTYQDFIAFRGLNHNG